MIQKNIPSQISHHTQSPWQRRNLMKKSDDSITWAEVSSRDKPQFHWELSQNLIEHTEQKFQFFRELTSLRGSRFEHICCANSIGKYISDENRIGFTGWIVIKSHFDTTLFRFYHEWSDECFMAFTQCNFNLPNRHELWLNNDISNYNTPMKLLLSGLLESECHDPLVGEPSHRHKATLARRQIVKDVYVNGALRSTACSPNVYGRISSTPSRVRTSMNSDVMPAASS